MTLLSPDETTAVDTPPRQVFASTWKVAVLAGALAVLLLAVGVAVGRATTSRSGRAEALDLDALATAWGSGDADQIRAFYTDDAVMMPFGHILSTLSSHPVPEYWDVNGPEMEREAAEHDGGTFQFLDANQIGDMLVTTGQWTFPEGMFPDSAQTVIKTADVMHLRDGKIWRHFGDFEVYVDGHQIEM